MGLTLGALFLVSWATQAYASCAHGTFLSPRAEDGAVEVGKFGYTGTTVRLLFPRPQPTEPANLTYDAGTT